MLMFHIFPLDFPNSIFYLDSEIRTRRCGNWLVIGGVRQWSAETATLMKEKASKLEISYYPGSYIYYKCSENIVTRV